MSTETGYDPDLMAAVTELGSAVRELLESSVASTVAPDELRAVAADARGLAVRLAATTRDRHTLSALDDLPVFRRVYSPVTGAGNGFAPPVTFRLVEDGDRRVVGEAVLGMRHEGPPSLAHGGVSALLMDQLLGSAAHLVGRWGMTARLDTEYRGPVPLQTPLVLTARIGEVSGRKTVVTGGIATASDPDTELVRGTAVFVTPRPEQISGYFGAVTTAAGEPARPHGAAAADPADLEVSR